MSLKEWERARWRWMISVLGAEKLSLAEIEAFLAASESMRFAGCGRAEIYNPVERLLCHHDSINFSTANYVTSNLAPPFKFVHDCPG
jgi:hypothetical protein